MHNTAYLILVKGAYRICKQTCNILPFQLKGQVELGQKTEIPYDITGNSPNDEHGKKEYPN